MSVSSTEIDGRRARRGRNREAVVDALLELFAEGDLNPSVTSVAERSGVSLRSVFRYFDDHDDMGRIAIARHSEKVEHLLALPGMGVGSRSERIGALVEHRVTLYEAVAPVVRAALIRAPFQPVIRAGSAARRSFLRDQVEAQFAIELSTLGPDDRFAVAAAADVLTSFEGLETLRVDRQLAIPEATLVLRGGLDHLLPR